jgi:hypothetical protein
MVRRDDARRKPGGWHGDLPDEWSPSLRHELALALACSVQSAETTIWLAWEMQARLPGTGALLADGKTYPQVLRLAEQAALTVDPGLAERRRQQAQKNARVTIFREMQGTAGLSGRDLPPDEALAAMAGVNARAQEYEDSGAFGATPMDALRAYAYLDLLAGRPAGERIACAVAVDAEAEIAEAIAWANARAARAAAPGDIGRSTGTNSRDDGGQVVPAAEDPGQVVAAPDDPGSAGRGGRDDEDPGDPGDSDGEGGGGPDAGGPVPGPGTGPGGRVLQSRPRDLIVPLMTLLGLAERPGEIQGFGLLDPALARRLAADAVAGPHTEICVTVTSREGYAIGHGCARPHRSARSAGSPRTAALPARLNLTVPAAVLGDLAGGAGPWAFTPDGSTGPPGGTGPPDGYGNWTLVLPDGRRFTVGLAVVPTLHCDHRHETGAYQPGAKLRHLVQVRDGTCTFPTCNRHARESDFEHGQPYQRGGRTCACNAGARSRACHRVKQSPGWNVAQPRPGWHQWTTPSGRVYVQAPKRYLA